MHKRSERELALRHMREAAWIDATAAEMRAQRVTKKAVTKNRDVTENGMAGSRQAAVKPKHKPRTRLSGPAPVRDMRDIVMQDLGLKPFNRDAPLTNATNATKGVTKSKRGRPKTGKAVSGAERVKRHRLRRKAGGGDGR